MTSLVLRNIPRYPARVTGTNGLTVTIVDGINVVVQPDFGSLVPVPAVTNPATTYFMAWDSGIDYYQSISFQDFADNLAEQVLGGSLTAIKDVVMAANQAIYFTSPTAAAAYDLSAFVRGISGSADAAAFRAAIGSDQSVNSVPALTGANLADNDKIGVYDTSASSSVSIVVSELIAGIFKSTRKIANAAFQDDVTFYSAAGLTKGFKFLASAITAGQTRTITVPDRDTTIGITEATSLALNGLTEAAFNIPAGARRGRISFDGLSTNGTVTPVFQLGVAASFVTTGYAGSVATQASSPSRLSASSGLPLFADVWAAAISTNGYLEFVHLSGNKWQINLNSGQDNSALVTSGSCVVTLSDTLTRARILLSSTAFDAGNAHCNWDY